MVGEITVTARDARDAMPPAETGRGHIQTSPSSTVGVANGRDASSKQASMLRADGNEVPAELIKKPSEVDRDDPNINVIELPSHRPTFKEQVYGYAKLIRGTVLGKQDAKEEGTQVLRGEQGIPQRRSSQSNKKD